MAETEPQPGPLNYILGFTLVGIAWGLTTPFIRKAAKDHHPPTHSILESEAVRSSWLKTKAYGIFFGVADLLRNPRYAIPLLLNLTGSIWFFLLIGKAGAYIGLLNFICFLPLCVLTVYLELSLTVPIVNTLAFLFTVIGDWWVDGKVISRSTPAPSICSQKCSATDRIADTIVGVVFSLTGIALCVQSKTK